MSLSSLKSAFNVQVAACESLGSPFMARICALIGNNLSENGPVWLRIVNWPGDVSPYGDSIPLRLAGALHGVVLEGLDAGLAAVYPPNHHEVSDTQLWAAIKTTIEQHSDYILKRLESAPQTNEVRRAGMLVPGLFEVAQKTAMQNFVMSELGASAGLNLFWDKYFYQFEGKNWGVESAKTRLNPDITGQLPEFVDLNVVSRAGCDLNPIDLTDQKQQILLLSYLWPDQGERIIRTREAIKLATQNDIHVEASDAVDWLKERLDQYHADAVHVVYHTIAWQYFPDDKKREGEALLNQAGKKATDNAPLAWLRLEADGQTPGAALTLTLWPSGETRILARGDFHGRWLSWND